MIIIISVAENGVCSILSSGTGLGLGLVLFFYSYFSSFLFCATCELTLQDGSWGSQHGSFHCCGEVRWQLFAGWAMESSGRSGAGPLSSQQAKMIGECQDCQHKPGCL